MGSDLLSVEAAVLNEDFVCPRSRNNYPRHIDSGDIALQCYRIAHGPALICRKLDSHRTQKVIIGVISRHGEDEIVLQTKFALRRLDQNMIAIDLGDRDVELAVPPHHRLHPLILPDIEVIVLRNFAVILERLFACGLLAGSAEWNIADLQQLRRSKERHVRWIVIDGVDHAALVNRNHFESRALSFDSTGQPGWASANDDDIGARVRTRDSLRAWKRVWYLLRRQSALSFWRAQLSC